MWRCWRARRRRYAAEGDVWVTCAPSPRQVRPALVRSCHIGAPTCRNRLRSVPPMTDPRRRLGAHGERLACVPLVERGYSLLDRNFRPRHGELDVVVRDERFLVFCEIKTRVVRGPPGPFGPLTAVGRRKRRQVREMARQWLAARADRLGRRPPELRFDAIGVTLEPSGRLVGVEHVEGAF